MAQKPQRIIEVAVIDKVGPITAERLMAMSEAEWGLLRQLITDARRGRDHRSIAACLRCGGAVFIKARAFRQKRLPYFAHFKGAVAACPWFTGDTQDPDSLKAGQYHGHQESPAHRLICEQIAQRLYRGLSRWRRQARQPHGLEVGGDQPPYHCGLGRSRQTARALSVSLTRAPSTRRGKAEARIGYRASRGALSVRSGCPRSRSI